MNSFEARLIPDSEEGLHCLDLATFQLNVGFRCNQQCTHCHHKASPERTQTMSWETMEAVLEAAKELNRPHFDITGGAPELNPNFKRLIKALHKEGYSIQTRTNLSVFSEPGMSELPQFLRDHGVQLVASLPCFLQENVCAQRGEGVYEKSVAGLNELNRLGYGVETELGLDLVYNPGGPFLPPGQMELEEEFRGELDKRFGIRFTRLLTITNMPMGRFLEDLQEEEKDQEYQQLLQNAFNPQTLQQLMCRHQISVGWDGSLYDCDFNMALGLTTSHGAPENIRDFDARLLEDRRIVTGPHCFGCSAGAGSSCGGALLE